MAKHNLQWDENKLKRFLREGRGQGEGQNYKPWVTVQDFPSKGRCGQCWDGKPIEFTIYLPTVKRDISIYWNGRTQ